MSPLVDPVPTINLIFEYQPIALEILTQISRCKSAEKADEKLL